METHQDFLNFNGQNIIVLTNDAKFWVAVRPICEALHVDFRKAHRRIKSHPILSQETKLFKAYSNADKTGQKRSMLFISDEVVNGWILMLETTDQKAIEYQRTCLKLLYNFFHGVDKVRKSLLFKKKNLQKELNSLNAKKINESPIEKEIKHLEQEIGKINKEIRVLDKKVISGPELFPEDDTQLWF